MEENALQPNQIPLRRPVRTIGQEISKTKKRIPMVMAVLLIVVAASIDIFQAVLNPLGIGEFLSPVISVCADVIFLIWFWILGVGFVKSPKKLLAMGTQALVGLIPVIDTLPELTIGVIAIILLTRAEDKGGALGQVASLTQGKLK